MNKLWMADRNSDARRYIVVHDDELYHWGVKGMKWGKHLFETVYQPVKNAYNWVTGSKASSDLNKAKKNYAAAKSGNGPQLAGGNSTAQVKKQPVQNAQRAYNNTLPGRVNSAMDSGRKALGNVGNWFQDRARDVSNWAQPGLNNVRRAADNVSDWVGDRANDVRDWAQPGLNNARNAMDRAGDWVGDRANDVRDWATGDQARKDMERAQNMRNFTQEGVDQAQARERQAWKDYTDAEEGVFRNPRDQGGDTRNVDNPREGRNTLKNAAKNAAADRAFDEYIDARNDLWRGQDAVRGYNQDYREASDAYDRTLPGLLGRAGEWIGDRASDVRGAMNRAGDLVGDRASDIDYAVWNAGNNARNAASNARNWVGDRARDVRDWAGNAANNARIGLEDARDWVMDNPVQDTRNWVGDRAADARNVAGDIGYEVRNWAQPGINNARNAYDNVSNNAINAYNDVRDRARETADDIRGRVTSDAWAASDAIRNAAGRAGNTVRNAASSVGNWARDRYNDVTGETARQAQQNFNDAVQEYQSLRNSRFQGQPMSDRERELMGYINSYLNAHPEEWQP